MRSYIMVFTDLALSLAERVEHAGFVLSFLAAWRIENTNEHGKNWKAGYLTAQTHDDIVLSLTTLVLTIKLLRDHFSEELFGQLFPSRLSSRFLEYLFADCSAEIIHILKLSHILSL